MDKDDLTDAIQKAVDKGIKKAESDERDAVRTKQAAEKLAKSSCGSRLIGIWLIVVILFAVIFCFTGGDLSAPIMFAIITGIPIGIIVKVMSWFEK